MSLITNNKFKNLSGTKEWADRNINCIDGCKNNCKYCYAKFMAIRFKRRKNPNDWKDMKIRDKIVSKKFKKINGRIMFPSSHDIFPYEPYLSACLDTIKHILIPGNSILITTKPSIYVIKTICKKFYKFQPQIQFRFTIGSIDNNQLTFWEPNAPSYIERKESLVYAYKKGFKTSISAEPLLDFDPRDLIKDLLPFVSESFWIGIMNYIPRKKVNIEEIKYYNEVRKNREIEHLLKIVNWTKNYDKIRFKSSIQNKIELSLKKI